jgi:hypothetical protein
VLSLGNYRLLINFYVKEDSSGQQSMARWMEESCGVQQGPVTYRYVYFVSLLILILKHL